MTAYTLWPYRNVGKIEHSVAEFAEYRIIEMVPCAGQFMHAIKLSVSNRMRQESISMPTAAINQ